MSNHGKHTRSKAGSNRREAKREHVTGDAGHKAKAVDEEFSAEMTPESYESRVNKDAYEEEFSSELIPRKNEGQVAKEAFNGDASKKITPHSYKQAANDDLFDEEYSAEVAPQSFNAPVKEEREGRQSEREGNDAVRGITTGAAIGWAALVMAIASLFIYPAVLGTGGVIVGFIAYMQGHRALGVWSIVIGAIAFIAYFALAPFY